uniref:Essential MCU regulator, mitochondrial n=1 Tax=Salarias fasciatus TaxID=181472 RepID=A0A672IVH7_SALFA
NLPMTSVEFACSSDFDQTPFGLVRIALVVVPFLYVGTLISKNFAALLEEHDIFVPEDDDDDD